MPLPTQIHQNKALENISIAYRPGGFIADRLVPTVPVMKETDIYYVYDNDIMSLPETIRANGAESKRAFFNVSTATYALKEHALHDYVTQRDRDNADKAIKPDIDVTESLTNKILIRREEECRLIVQTKGNWSNEYSLTSTFSWNQNTTLSDPITRIDSSTSKIIESSGFTPNKLVVNDPTFRALRVHNQVLEKVKYTSIDSIGEQMLARLFDVQELLVAKAIRDTSEEGINTVTTGFLYTDTALLAYMEPSPGLRKASAIYQFVKNGASAPFKVFQWLEPTRGENTKAIEVSSMFQFKAVATSCGFHIGNTLS